MLDYAEELRRDKPAAVVSLLTRWRFVTIIVPAPMKPMPEATAALIREIRDGRGEGGGVGRGPSGCLHSNGSRR